MSAIIGGCGDTGAITGCFGLVEMLQHLVHSGKECHGVHELLLLSNVDGVVVFGHSFHDYHELRFGFLEHFLVFLQHGVQVSRFGIVVGFLVLPMGFVVRIGLESGWLAYRVTIATEGFAVFGVVRLAMMELAPWDHDSRADSESYWC